MKSLMAAIVLLSLVGCGSVNYRKTNIDIYSGSDTTIDASGASNTTGVDQESSYDLGKALEAAKGWLDKNPLKILDALKGGEDIKIPVENTVVPQVEGSGDVEVID
jgi:hypothetical protein